MSWDAGTLWGLAGVFAGGAFPWLEAPIVIPGGILAGLPVVPVVIAGVVGNLLTVAVAAWFGESIRAWWTVRRARRLEELARTHPEKVEAKQAKKERGRRRVQAVMDRGGLPAVGLLGPIAIGTQFAALAAVALGATARASFVWVAVGTVLWSLLAMALALGGVELFG